MNDTVQVTADTKEVESAYESNSIFWVEIEKIVPNPYQPRKEFNEQKLQELAESIRMYGVLQPLVVTRKEVTLPNGAFRTEYELIAGERRLRASKLSGLAQVPVIIRSSKETDLMKLELAIIENLQREDLNPVDRALAFDQLSSKFGLNHSEIGKRMGRSRVYVANSIRLLGLPEYVLTAVRNGELSDGHARALLMLKDRPEEQEVIFRETILKKLSVREVEHLGRQIATDKVRKKSWKDLEPELKEMEKSFSETLGTKVQIAKTDYGGRVVIDYFSQEDLNQILRVVRGESSWGNERATEAERAQEVLQSLAASTGLDIAEVATQVAQDPDEPDAPQEIARAMEEEVTMVAEDEAPAAAEGVDMAQAESQPAPETALEVDNPNDHALVAAADLPTARISTEADIPERSLVAEQQPAPVEEKPAGYTDDDLYSLKHFSL